MNRVDLLRPVLILSSHLGARLPGSLFPSSFTARPFCEFLSCLLRATCLICEDCSSRCAVAMRGAACGRMSGSDGGCEHEDGLLPRAVCCKFTDAAEVPAASIFRAVTLQCALQMSTSHTSKKLLHVSGCFIVFLIGKFRKRSRSPCRNSSVETDGGWCA